MKPISEFVVQMDAAESELKKTVLAAFKSIDEAKAVFIDSKVTAILAPSAFAGATCQIGE